jgi:hypothetical protein
MIFKLSLPSVQNKTLGKETLCRVLKISAKTLCRLSKKHSAKNSLPSVKNKILDKEFLCRVFFLPRVFCLALGKEPKKILGKSFDTRQRAEFR